MITGNATTHFESNGYQCDITSSIIHGTGVQITLCPALVVPVSTQFGKVEINVALRGSTATDLPHTLCAAGVSTLSCGYQLHSVRTGTRRLRAHEG